MGCGAAAGYAVPSDATLNDSHSTKAQASKCSDRATESPQAEPQEPSGWEAAEGCVHLLRANGAPAHRRLAAELQAMLDAGGGPRGESAASSASAPASPQPFAAPRSVSTLLEWEARLCGPPGTPYAGGVFQLGLQFPEAYPFKPPDTKFVTPCYHPNVGQEGEICLNVLKEEWSPLLTVSTLLLCISALLSHPSPEDPLNASAAELLDRRPAEFQRVAREWTRRYACGRPGYQSA